MIYIFLHYKQGGKTQRMTRMVYAVPRIGEKILLPGDLELTVLTIEHDLREVEPKIWVVLN